MTGKAGSQRIRKSTPQEGAKTDGSDSGQSGSLTCEKGRGGREQKSQQIGRGSEGICEDQEGKVELQHELKHIITRKGEERLQELTREEKERHSEQRKDEDQVDLERPPPRAESCASR